MPLITQTELDGFGQYRENKCFQMSLFLYTSLKFQYQKDSYLLLSVSKSNWHIECQLKSPA